MTESKFDYRKILSKYSIVLVLIVIMIACTFANSSFLTANNLINVCRQQSVIIILAFGEMILIICGQLDLSCGSVIALSGVLSVMTYKSTQSMALSLLCRLSCQNCSRNQRWCLYCGCIPESTGTRSS